MIVVCRTYSKKIKNKNIIEKYLSDKFLYVPYSVLNPFKKNKK